MCEHYGHIALADVEEYEEQEEGNTRDDVRVEHRDVVEKSHCLLCLSSHVVDSDGSHTSEESGYHGGYKGNDEGVLNRLHEGIGSLHVSCEEVGVQLC